MSNDSFEIICPRCRAEAPVDAEECPACGHALTTRSAAPPKRRPAVPRAPLSTPSGAMRVQLPQHLAVAGPDVLYRPVRFAPSSYAGFWIRFVGWVIDSALILGTTVAVAYLGAPAAAATAVYLAGVFLYYPLLESSGAQGTIGKLLCGRLSAI